MDGLTLKTETLASPSSRYDLKIIFHDIWLSIIFPLGSEGQSIILEALLQGQAMLQVRIISNDVCLIIITSLLIIRGLKLIPSFYSKLRIKNSVWMYEFKNSFYPLQVILILREVSNTLLLMARTFWRPREPRYEFYSLVTWIRTLSGQLLKNISRMNYIHRKSEIRKNVVEH